MLIFPVLIHFSGGREESAAYFACAHSLSPRTGRIETCCFSNAFICGIPSQLSISCILYKLRVNRVIIQLEKLMTNVTIGTLIILLNFKWIDK